MPKLLAISLNPNITTRDLPFLTKLLLATFLPVKKEAEVKFLSEFAQLFPNNNKDVSITAFYAGRTGWFAILKALGVGDGDEVLVPAFTCVAVVNPIRWVGATPIYVDINNDYIVDLKDAKNKLSDRTKVFLMQYTFGLVPENLSDYIEFAKEHGLFFVEDCAHALDPQLQNQGIGLNGVASFFSFGRDKCLTAGTGGVAVTLDPSIAAKISTFAEKLPQTSRREVMRYLVYLIGIEKVYWWYRLHSSLGKLFHAMLFSVGIVQTANSPREKQGELEPGVMKRWHPVFARLASYQLQRLPFFADHRRRLADFYLAYLSKTKSPLILDLPGQKRQHSWLRFSLQVSEPKRIFEHAAKKDIMLGDWYNQVVGPQQVSLDNIGYQIGTAPNAEQLSRHVMNLPTAPRFSQGDAQKIIDLVQAQKI